jgi:diacylglycerol kinase
MVCYALLALVAAIQLDGAFRLAVWIFLAGLALKTWIAAFKRQ